MEFPESASMAEREIKWRKIAEISDADFGFTDLTEKPDKARFGVRVCLFNERGEICMIKSEKYGYHQMPGGGIDEGEGILEALMRETAEETGWKIKDVEPLGYVIEHREGARDRRPFNRWVEFAFTAQTDEFVGTNYMDDEIAEGFTPVWLTVDKAVKIFESAEGKIENYSGNFSNRRDLLVLKTL